MHVVVLHVCPLGARGATCRAEKAASVSCKQRRGDSHPAGIAQQCKVLCIPLSHTCIEDNIRWRNVKFIYVQIPVNSECNRKPIMFLSLCSTTEPFSPAALVERDSRAAREQMRQRWESLRLELKTKLQLLQKTLEQDHKQPVQTLWCYYC